MRQRREPLIDWDNPPQLDAPRRRVVRALNDDRIKLIRLKQKRAKGPKKHSTNKERSFEERQKAATVARNKKKTDEAREKRKAQIKAYWAGELDHYPGTNP